MNEQDAIGILVQVANLAQERGLLTLKDANLVVSAIALLQPNNPQLTSAKEQQAAQAAQPVMEKV